MEDSGAVFPPGFLRRPATHGGSLLAGDLYLGFFGIHAAATHALRLDLRDLPMVALFAVTGVTVFYSTYQMAIRGGGAALASLFLYTAPAWVALLARFVFKEPFTRPKIIALVLTLIGVVRVAAGGGI